MNVWTVFDCFAVLAVATFLLWRAYRRRVRAEQMRTIVAMLAVLIAERGSQITDVLRSRDGYRLEIHAWALALGVGCTEEELVKAKEDAPIVAHDFFTYLHSPCPERVYREREGGGYRWRR